MSTELNKWDHQGVVIHFDPIKAEFFATIKNENKNFGSLAAAKKAIDAARASSFSQFTAHAYVRVEHAGRTTHEGMRAFPIVDLKKIKDRGRYGSTNTYFVDSGGNTHRFVLKADPRVVEIVKRAGEIRYQAYLDKSAIEKAEQEAIGKLRTELEQYSVSAATFEVPK